LGEHIGNSGLLLTIVLFVFFSYCLKLICGKARIDPGVMIWIPFVQMIPTATVAGINPFLLLLYFIPLVNIVFMFYHWVKVCAAINKSPWLVVIIVIPLVNLAFLPLLAFG
tara:strand:+ start:311 stop:643 length:333 start_codon:yes stop_codon:yes gene_type:complete